MPITQRRSQRQETIEYDFERPFAVTDGRHRDLLCTHVSFFVTKIDSRVDSWIRLSGKGQGRYIDLDNLPPQVRDILPKINAELPADMAFGSAPSSLTRSQVRHELTERHQRAQDKGNSPIFMAEQVAYSEALRLVDAMEEN